MSPTDIHRHVCQAIDDFVQRQVEERGSQNWDSLRADLSLWVRGLESSIAFAGLLSVLESESRYQYQDIAGEVLTNADIPCPLALPEFMQRAFSSWNQSAGAVPRYAAHAFGREAILDCVRDLMASKTGGISRSKMEAVLYWLGGLSVNG
jgi:hypothetical protein